MKRSPIKAKPKRARTKQEREHMARVATLPCCVANTECFGRVTVHHLTGGKSASQKRSDFETIPLCEAHHQHGGFGVAVHAGVQTWEENHKTQEQFLEMTRCTLSMLYPDFCPLTGVSLDRGKG